MIMAGRGHRLTNISNEAKQVGIRKTLSEDLSSFSLAPVLKKINSINTNDNNQSLLVDIQNELKELFTSKNILKEVLCDFHRRALHDAEFGEKLVLALEQFSNFEVDGILLRGELLSFIQNDFKAKDTMAQSDPKTFLNSVLLLGNIYHKFKVCGEPIAILGAALLEYFNLLLEGKEEELKTLAKQICINGTKLSEVSKYELLMQKLRNVLVKKNLSTSSKCWVLLAIDFMSNNYVPLKKVVDDFYVNQLGEEYIKLKAVNQAKLNTTNFSRESPKNEESSSSEKKYPNLISNQSHGSKKNLSQNFSDLKIKSDTGFKDAVESSNDKTFRRGCWKNKAHIMKSSEHDDRFEKDESRCGVLKPRQVKPENRRNFDFKSNNKEFSSFKIDGGNKTDSKFKTASYDS